jgi:hypothetical protein
MLQMSDRVREEGCFFSSLLGLSVLCCAAGEGDLREREARGYSRGADA